MAGGGGPSTSTGAYAKSFSGDSAMSAPSWERVASRLGASNVVGAPAAAPAGGVARLGIGDLLMERCTSISIAKKAPRGQGLAPNQRAATLGAPGTRSPLRLPQPPADSGPARDSGANPSKPPSAVPTSSQQSSDSRSARVHFCWEMSWLYSAHLIWLGG